MAMLAARVAAVVVSYRSLAYIDRCLRSLVDAGIDEIWVVDNASDDGTAEYVATHYPQVHLVRNTHNVGFAAANNLALRQMNLPYTLLLNPDAWLEAGAVEAMVQSLQSQQDLAVIGPRVVRGGEIEPTLLQRPSALEAWRFLVSGMRAYDTGGFAGRAVNGYPWPDGGEGDHVRGACMLVRRDAVEQAGLLDERFFLYFEETEWCLRLCSRGWRVALTPDAVAHHVGKASVKETAMPSLEYMRSAILFWSMIYPSWQAWSLRLTLAAMCAAKLVLLGWLPGRREMRMRLVAWWRLAWNPYALAIPYPAAQRPACWPEGGEADV